MENEVLKILEKIEKMACRKCGIVKDITDFAPDKMRKHGRKTQCRVCRQAVMTKWKHNHPENVKKSLLKSKKENPDYRREYRLKNLEKVNSVRRKWADSNREKMKETTKKWREENREKYLECKRKQRKRYKKLHKEKVNEQRRLYAARKRIRDAKFRLSQRMSNGIRKALREGKNGRAWEFLVGYSRQQLRRSIERKFLPGMTWDNMGEWHIDHIIPVSVFNFKTYDDIDFKRCWALSNLQPMWGVDNLKKGNKLSKSHQPSLLITT